VILHEFVALLLATTVPNAMAAQRLVTERLPLAGTRVRVRTSQSAGQHAVVVGSLQKVGVDSLVIADVRGASQGVALANVTHLEIGRGRRQGLGALRGFGLGVLGGVVVGATLGALVSPEHHGECAVLCGKGAGAFSGGLIGIALGGTVGAVLGASRGPERWERGWISPTESWTPARWSVRGDMGRSAINSSANSGNVYGLRLTRDVKNAGLARVGFGYAHGSLASDFNTLDVTVELVPLRRGRWTPTFALGGGSVYDHTSFDAFGHVAGGIELRLHPRLRLRGAQQWGTHRERDRWNVGPNLTTIGAAFRLGPGE
jgi:hypothetical protein